jgi:Ca-activated chloride channel family protein
MRSPSKRLLAAAVLTGLAALQAQDPRVAVEPRARPGAAPAARSDIRVDTTVVLIPVAVTDPMGRSVISLDRADFRLTEDRVEQQIAYFAQEDAPISIGLLFDSSSSMREKMPQARRAVAQFLKTAHPDDEFLLIQFDDTPELLENFTRDAASLHGKLLFVEPEGQTALYDAVYMGLEKMKAARNARKALLIISDGGDNASRYTESDVKRRVRESDVQIYAIGIFPPILSPGRIADDLGGRSILNQLAQLTGGRHFAVERIHDLPDIAGKIGVELRNQYVLGYTSTNTARDGKYRKVQVKVTPPKYSPPLRVYARPGYVAPR